MKSRRISIEQVLFLGLPVIVCPEARSQSNSPSAVAADFSSDIIEVSDGEGRFGHATPLKNLKISTPELPLQVVR